MPSDASDYDEWLSRIASGERPQAALAQLSDGGTRTLETIAAYLARRDLPIDAVERLEDVAKATIGKLATGTLTLAAAHDLARALKRLGFFHKLKSYAVKAASPLGYSVFFQRPGEGFSFQRHVTHKIEIFHILAAPPGSYVFVCEHEAWRAVFEPSRFRRWLAGASDPDYDCFRHVPEPGDMIVIDRLNVVHTVIGCVLEEFATISTDMVDRLFDQNAGSPIPRDFTRAHVDGLLRALPAVEPRRVFEVGASGLIERPQHADPHPWGERRRVTIGPLTASHVVVNPGATTELSEGDVDASSIFVRSGHGTLALVSDAEAPVEIPLEPGALTLVPAGVRFRLNAAEGAPLRISQQSLPLATAFGASNP